MSLSPKVYHDKIFYYEKILDNPDQIINALEETENSIQENGFISKWEEWVTSEGDYQFGFRKSINLNNSTTGSEDIAKQYFKIKQVLNLAINDYATVIGVPVGNDSDIGFSKYLKDKYMGPHTDIGPQSHISAVLYLNDNFEGGELCFPNQDICIKPKAGSIIVFPSVEPYVHDPKPASEVKYMVPAFWYLENSPLISA